MPSHQLATGSYLGRWNSIQFLLCMLICANSSIACGSPRPTPVTNAPSLAMPVSGGRQDPPQRKDEMKENNQVG